MPEPPAAPAPRVSPAPAASLSETVALEIGALEATLPPLPGEPDAQTGARTATRSFESVAGDES